MATTQTTVVVGIFSNQSQARQAIEELQHAGFNDNELGFLTRAGALQSASDLGASAANGAVEGGLFGGVLGAAAALLIPGLGPALAGGIIVATLSGAAIGATAGGLLGVLATIGISEADARLYRKALSEGHTIITVKIPVAQADAEAILHHAGAQRVKTHIGLVNTIPPQ